MAFIDAYDTRTGEKLPHQVPEHFLTIKSFDYLSKTPKQKASDTKTTTQKKEG